MKTPSITFYGGVSTVTGANFLIVGYQALGTLGRELKEGRKKVKINGKEISVRASVEKFGCFSGHKDSDRLVGFVENTKNTL